MPPSTDRRPTSHVLRKRSCSISPKRDVKNPPLHLVLDEGEEDEEGAEDEDHLIEPFGRDSACPYRPPTCTGPLENGKHEFQIHMAFFWLQP